MEDPRLMGEDPRLTPDQFDSFIDTSNIDPGFATLGSQIKNQVLGPSAPPTSWVEEIAGNPEKAKEYLYNDPRTKDAITKFAKIYNNTNLEGKSQQEVAEWFLRENRESAGSIAYTLTDKFRASQQGPENKQLFNEMLALYDTIPAFTGGVANTFWDIGAPMATEVAAGAAIGAAIAPPAAPIGAAVGGTLSATRFIVSRMLAGAGTREAELAAQRAIAQGASKYGAGKAAFAAGARGEAMAGASYEGALNLARQGYEKEIGAREDYSAGEAALSAGIGAIGGGVLGGGIHAATNIPNINRFTKRFSGVSGASVGRFTQSNELNSYIRQVDIQKTEIESRINQIKDSKDPANQAELMELVDEYRTLEIQRDALSAVQRYAEDRPKAVESVSRQGTTELVEAQIKSIEELDKAYATLGQSKDPQAISDALEKFGREYGIADTITADTIASRFAAREAEMAARPQEFVGPEPMVGPQQPADLAADISRVGDEIAETQKQADEAIEEAAQKTAQEIEAEQLETNIAARVEQTLQDAGVTKEAGPSVAAPGPTPETIPDGVPSKFMIEDEPILMSGQRLKKKDIVAAVTKKTGRPAEDFEAFIKSMQKAGSKAPNVKQLVDYANQFSRSIGTIGKYAPIVTRVNTSLDTMLQTFFDENIIVDATQVQRMLQPQIDKLTASLPPSERKVVEGMVMDSINTGIEQRIMAATDEAVMNILSKMEITPELLDDIAKLTEEAATAELARTSRDKVTYSLQKIVEMLPEHQRTTDNINAITAFARNAAREIEKAAKLDASRKYTEAQKRVALDRILTEYIRKQTGEVLSPEAGVSRGRSVNERGDVPVIQQDGEIITGRNQRKDVLGRVEVGGVQGILRPENTSTRMAATEGGKYIGAGEAARRAIWRAATAVSKGKRVQPSATFRDINGFKVGREEGNVSKYYVESPDGSRTPITASEAREIELFRAVENYQNGYSPNPRLSPKEHFSRVLDTVRTRYTRPIKADEMEAIVKSVVEGKSLFDAPKTRGPRDNISFEDVLPKSKTAIKNVEEMADKLRGIALARAAKMLASNEIDDATLGRAIDKIYSLSDEELIDAAYKKMEKDAPKQKPKEVKAKKEVATQQPETVFDPKAEDLSRRSITPDDLNKTLDDFPIPSGSMLVMRDPSGALKYLARGQTIASRYGEDALGWEVGTIPYFNKKSGKNRAIAASKFKNLATLTDEPPRRVRFDALSDKDVLSEDDIARLSADARELLDYDPLVKKPISIKNLYERISLAESDPWPSNIDDLAAFREAYTELVALLNEKAPGGIELTRETRNTAKRQIMEVFAGSRPSDIVFLNKLIDGLGGDERWAPLIRPSSDGTSFYTFIGEAEARANSINVGEEQLRVFSFTHELAHWAFRNILSFEDRIKYFELVEAAYDPATGKFRPQFVDDMLPDMIANRLDSPQEMFANQFTQWVFSQNKHAIDDATATNIFYDYAKAVGKKIQEAINRIINGKKYIGETPEGEQPLFDLFEQIVSFNETRPSKMLKREDISNESSLYFYNIHGRLNEKVDALESAINSANPIALHESIQDGIGFMKWLGKNSRGINFYTKGTNQHLKLLGDDHIKEVMSDFVRRIKVFDDAIGDELQTKLNLHESQGIDYADEIAKFGSDDVLERSSFEELAMQMAQDSEELIGEQQIIALRVKSALDHAMKQAVRKVAQVERRAVPTLANDDIIKLYDDALEKKVSSMPAKTDKRSSKQLRDAIRFDDPMELDHIVKNLEYRGAGKLKFDEDLVNIDLMRRVQDDGSLDNMNFRTSETEADLLSAINHKDPKVAKDMQLMAVRALVNYSKEISKPVREFTDADLAQFVGIKSSSNAPLNPSSDVFKAFRKNIKDLYFQNYPGASPRAIGNTFILKAPPDNNDNFLLPEYKLFADGDDAYEFFTHITKVFEKPEAKMRDVLDYIAGHPSSISPSYVKVAQRLRQLGFVDEVPIIATNDLQKFDLGAYIRNPNKIEDDIITINFGLVSGKDGEYRPFNASRILSVIMHEAVHAATLRYLNGIPETMVNDAIDLHKKIFSILEEKGLVGKRIDKNGNVSVWPYGMSNWREMFAEALTNGEFQNTLNRVTFNDGTSAWSRLVAMIGEILGIRDKSALSEVIKMSDAFMRANKEVGEALSDPTVYDMSAYIVKGVGEYEPLYAKAFDDISFEKQLIQDGRIPPSLVGAYEQEIGRPVFFNVNGKLSLKPKTSIPDTPLGIELKVLDDDLAKLYVKMSSANDTEVKNLYREQLELGLQEREIIARELRKDGHVVDATPVEADIKSIFRLDDGFQYAKDEVAWLARAGNKEKEFAAIDAPVITGDQLVDLIGEKQLTRILKEKGIDAISIGSNKDELVPLNVKPKEAKRHVNRDRIVFNMPEEEPVPGISGIMAMGDGSYAPGASTMISRMAEAQGAPEGVGAMMRRMLNRKPVNDKDKGIIRKLWDKLGENSIQLRQHGMRYVADFIKPENGVGLYERHNGELAKKIVPIFNTVESLPDATNVFKRWLRKTNPVDRSVQPASHKRIVAALRRADPSNLESKQELDAYKQIQDMLQAELDNMRKEGIPVGDVRMGNGVNGYFPQVWDADKINADPNKFTDMFAKWFKQQADADGELITMTEAEEKALRLMKKLTDDDGGVIHQAFGYADVIGDSFMKRVLRLSTDDLNKLGLEEFMVNDLEGILAKYFDSTTRKQLFHKQFGINNHGITTYRRVLAEGMPGAKAVLMGETQHDHRSMIPAAFANDFEAQTAVERLYETARSKDRPIALAEIESAINGYYAKFGSSKFAGEFDKRASALANAIVDSVEANVTGDTMKYFDNVMDSVQQKLVNAGTTSQLARNVSSNVRTFNAITLLPFTTLTSFADVILPMLRSGNMTAWAKGMAEYTTIPEYREAARRMGASVSTILHDRLSHVYGADSSQLTNAFFNATLLTPWTKRMREMSVVIGYEALRADAELAQRLIAQGNMNTRQFRLAKKRLEYYGLDEFTKPGAKSFGNIQEAEGNDSIRYALMKFANETIYEPNNNDVPIWAQTPIGKMMYQLKSFPHMMARNVMRSASQNEIEKFALAFLVMGPAGGATALAAKDFVMFRGGEDGRQSALRDRKISESFGGLQDVLTEDQDRLLGWYAESMLAFGGLGLFAELLYNAAEQADNGAYGKMRVASSILGPSFGTGVKAMDIGSGLVAAAVGDDSNARQRQAVRTATSIIPIAGGMRGVREGVTDTLAGPPSSEQRTSMNLPLEDSGFSSDGFSNKGWGS